MNRDPLFQKINEQLAGRIDPDLFERCVADLLRDVYPSLVPIDGGGDEGFDGAVATPDGPFPLITTTSDDVLGNVRRNLDQYLETNPDGPRRAVVGTRTKLTPRRRRNIQKAADERGVVIVQIHDGQDIAARLYRAPHWRMDLLGVPGDPPALSIYPRSGRTFGETIVVGREATLSRLRQGGEDLLLVGQPGSGKTYLHQAMVTEDRCRFVVTNDLAAIADDLRESQAPCLVVDDAHTALELLEKLVHLRTQLGADYTIHANCWPQHKDRCMAVLRLSENSVIDLHPLPRPEIAKIIDIVGVKGPDRLLALILDQAAGKPGLAATLANACLRGEITSVWSGEMLARQLLAGRQVASGERDIAVLASFGLGGETGLPLETVAASLGEPPVHVREVVTNLGAGGVIEEHANTLAVYPAELRSLLVARTFFCGSTSLPYAGLVAGCTDHGELARTLCAARQRGGAVPTDLIRTQLERTSDTDAWQHFAWLDQECARVVIQDYPEKIALTMGGLLEYVPTEALSALLEKYSAATPRSTNDFQTAQQAISDWVQDGESAYQESVARRRKLIATVAKNLDEYPSAHAAWCLAEAVNPSYESVRSSPVEGRTFQWSRRMLPLEGIRELVPLWHDVIAALERLAVPFWRPVLAMLESWCLPSRFTGGRNAPSSVMDALEAASKPLVERIADIHPEHPGVQAWAKGTAEWAGFEQSIKVDPDYEALFMDRARASDWREEHERKVAYAQALGIQLASQSPAEGVQRLSELIQYARDMGDLSLSTPLVVLADSLASTVSLPSNWAEAMMNATFPDQLVLPLLRLASQRAGAKGHELLLRAMESESYRRTAIGLSLEIADVQSEPTQKALCLLTTEDIDTLFLSRFDIPIATRGVLLRHSRGTVRTRIALAEWNRSRDSAPPSELWSEWRRQIVNGRFSRSDYCLREIFEAYPDVAFEWALNAVDWLAEDRDLSIRELLCVAAEQLDRQQREVILIALSPHALGFDLGLFDALVKDEYELFAKWLSSVEDSEAKGIPLQRLPTERWVRLATVALDQGMTPEELADHTAGPRSDGWSGSGVEHYSEIVGQYESLLEHPDQRLHPAARRGCEWARWRLGHCRERQLTEDIYGFNSNRRFSI